MLLSALFVYLEMRPMQRPTFSSDPIAAALLFGLPISAIPGAFIGVWAIIVGRERSFMIFISIIVGAIALAWTIAEIIGH